MLCALRPVMIWIGLFGRFCGRFGFCGWVFGGFWGAFVCVVGVASWGFVVCGFAFVGLLFLT